MPDGNDKSTTSFLTKFLGYRFTGNNRKVQRKQSDVKFKVYRKRVIGHPPPKVLNYTDPRSP